ncbi:MAG TPA: TonB-dependent receptor [Burkholderiales bacterium]|nr:TonB-dependent receptor [Burkholderiales bacterium]
MRGVRSHWFGYAAVALASLAALASASLLAAGTQTLDPVEVIGSGLVGAADSANQGTVLHQQIESRPAYRPGEILENVPGLIITQHSGEGKATQYFLRGFNLDHGTDFAVSVDGVPTNLRTHGHGQGYSDLNFLVPELVGGIQYKKGPYYAEEGDFAAAGAARVRLLDRLDRGIGEIGLGNFGYRRTLLADSPELADGRLLYALELYHNDGPWTNPEDYRKINAVLRYSEGSRRSGFNVTAMAYRGNWNATDQIARRAVDSGQMGRLDSIDPTDGGRSHRYAISAAWRRTQQNGTSEANAYVVQSDLKLFSNFTYFLVDPVNGDQFEQSDRRVMSGVNLKHTWTSKWGRFDVENSAGVQVRNDNISVGLFNTRAQERLSTTRYDHVTETSGGIYFQNVAYWADKFRTVAGLRADYFRADVNSDNASNSGKTNDHMVSPKLTLVFGPWAQTEYYLNYGQGFHSNDARGTTITVDPKTGNPAQQVPFLVRATGYETGVRTAIVPHLQTSLALFHLDLASELLFVGDAGTTEPSRPSRRTGIEFSNLYTPTSWLLLDADIAFSRARFTDSDIAGPRIPGAIEGVATFTASVENLGPYYGSFRLRYFGPRPLIEDNSVRSSSTTLLSGRVGYKFNKNLRLQLDVFNLLDRRVSQIDYFYESQLRGEAAPARDVHFHPAEPRSFRTTLIASF